MFFIRQICFRVHVRMVISYHTANSVAPNVVWCQTAKFNDGQYFRLYGIYTCKWPYLEVLLIITTKVPEILSWNFNESNLLYGQFLKLICIRSIRINKVHCSFTGTSKLKFLDRTALVFIIG